MTILAHSQRWLDRFRRVFPSRAHVSTARGQARRRGWTAPCCEVLEDRTLLTPYSVAAYMGWSGPASITPVTDYLSSLTWQGLRIINYAPGHYPYINSSGKVTFSGLSTALNDPSFQADLTKDFLSQVSGGPTSTQIGQYGTYINFLLGGNVPTIYHDLQQLKAAGFDGVRLYEVNPTVVIPTILAAHQLGMSVELEAFVALPGVSQAQLFTDLVNIGPGQSGGAGTEGQLQQLYYDINIVGAQVFKSTVPLVFFDHEQISDANSITNLQFGINATRALLKKVLGATGGPAVTTAFKADQIASPAQAYHAQLAPLITTIQLDKHAPIAYDPYPFQWDNQHYSVSTPYPSNSPGNVPNAYPQAPGGGDITYYDSGTGGTFTVDQTVAGKSTGSTYANIQYSLQWMVDRVNWLWNNPSQAGPGTTYQLIAETGWASAGNYPSPQGPITGSVASAAAYYNTLAADGFALGSGTGKVPAIYFEAYDEPLKDPATDTALTMTSENHYGIYTWSDLPKPGFNIAANPTHDNLFQFPFAVVAITPGNFGTAAAQAFKGESATSTYFSFQITGSGAGIVPTAGDVPWVAGSGLYSDKNPVPGGGTVTYMPAPAFFLSSVSATTKVAVTLTPAHLKKGASDQKPITLTFDPSKPFGQDVSPPGQDPSTGANLTTPVVGSNPALPWTLNLAWPWGHAGSNDYTNYNSYPKVFQDYWGSPSHHQSRLYATANRFSQQVNAFTLHALNTNKPGTRLFGFLRLVLFVQANGGLVTAAANAARTEAGFSSGYYDSLLQLATTTSTLSWSNFGLFQATLQDVAARR